MGISSKTLQRWSQQDNHQDGRLDALHEPPNKLSELERQPPIRIANEPAYADFSPSKIVPKLADEGIFLASESTFHRVLKADDQLHHSQKARPARQVNKPMRSPLPRPINFTVGISPIYRSSLRSCFFYLYLVRDIYRRKIVGWQVHEEESSALAADSITAICAQEGIERHPVMLHSDNGGPMKGAILLARLQQMGVIPSFSRPSGSHDNPYSESLFRTLKYRPEYLEQPFADLQSART